LDARSQYELSSAFLLTAAAAVSFVVIIGLRETCKMPLSTTSAAPAEAASPLATIHPLKINRIWAFSPALRASIRSG
jgi:hypothetical protein